MKSTAPVAKPATTPESTAHLYGCNNRAPYKEQMVLKRTPEQVCLSQPGSSIPFRMARDCQYTNTKLGQDDERCNGCSWRSTPTSE